MTKRDKRRAKLVKKIEKAEAQEPGLLNEAVVSLSVEWPTEPQVPPCEPTPKEAALAVLAVRSLAVLRRLGDSAPHFDGLADIVLVHISAEESCQNVVPVHGALAVGNFRLSGTLAAEIEALL